MLTKPYPKDNEPRTMALPQHLVTQLADWISTRHLGPGDLLFATREGTPISRNTFRTRVWLPAIKASGVDFGVRVHDLRHAHASWLLAGGSDLKSVMDRMGHAQITTTQKYLHALPDADQKNLTALDRIRRTEPPRSPTTRPTKRDRPAREGPRPSTPSSTAEAAANGHPTTALRAPPRQPRAGRGRHIASATVRPRGTGIPRDPSPAGSWTTSAPG